MKEIREITIHELKDKLQRGDQFKLVMTYHERAYLAKYIPGSLNLHDDHIKVGVIEPTDEVVVYCINKQCSASINAYHKLESKGFNNLYRFAGGLEEWELAGLDLAGDAVDQ